MKCWRRTIFWACNQIQGRGDAIFGLAIEDVLGLLVLEQIGLDPNEEECEGFVEGERLVEIKVGSEVEARTSEAIVWGSGLRVWLLGNRVWLLPLVTSKE
ncbi:hypothetical protein VNO78_26704 [Psophocarpus tetragonolobus]|uniref:Uncharacterized protein n=1 Tax=Psophocarpus tetragonolobus TaxID=3891 RepID=A0AAN9RZZ4_PSOTE